MTPKRTRVFMCDFETTVYKGQEYTEVWASATSELFREDNDHLFHSISEQYEYFLSLSSNVIAYWHNLKFDGAFWLSYLLIDLGYKQALNVIDNGRSYVWKHKKDMLNGEFKFSMSDKGQFYTILIKDKGYFIEIRDSLKLLPFSVKRIGNSFGTKHKKLDMEYEGFRYAGCDITDDEQKYIMNDVYVPKEALEIMFKQGHNKLTIGSCCLSEYKSVLKHSLKTQLTYDEMFPDVYKYEIDRNIYGVDNAGDYIRKSYRGGWCYLVKGKENKIKKNGTTADVNSLYPSMMHSESGNYYPIGNPCFWKGNYIPDEVINQKRFFFVRVKTRFYLKEGYLPFIQIKGNYLYRGTECLESSDIVDRRTGEKYTHYPDENGNLIDTRVIMTMTMTDYYLFLEHYNVVDFEILDGCYFYTAIGIFDEYIDKYKEIKQNSKGAIRELAKLFLNNLYGKLASSTDSSFKIAYIKDDKSIGLIPVHEEMKRPGYIPCGSAITSYARNFTIRAAQKNYYGVNERGFIYADTDSIHCDLQPQEIEGIKVHKTNFCCWKLESKWDVGFFTRQKTYIEHVTEEDVFPHEDGSYSGDIVDPYYNVKCAGMPDRCKELFELSMKGTQERDGRIVYGKLKPWSEEEYNFLFDANGVPVKRTIDDFTIGLKIPGKLVPKRIKGGIVLNETTYEMR